MNDSEVRHSASRNSALRPDSQLTIYYLEGRLPAAVDVADGSFVGNWEEDGSSFLFFTRPAPQTMARLLAAHPRVKLLDAYHISYADWLGERLAPIRVGPFVFKPSWESSSAVDEVSAGTHGLWLDPGVVFGTGTHPSTRHCLEAIVLAFRSKPPRMVLDLGTGTGVLALAAASLGAFKVLAVDLNPLAVKTAQRNIWLNRMGNRILAVQGKAQDFVGRPADLLVANIHYDAMQQVMASDGFLKCRHFILSGLLRSDAPTVAHWLQEHGIDIVKQWDQDGVWHTFYGESV